MKPARSYVIAWMCVSLDIASENYLFSPSSSGSIKIATEKRKYLLCEGYSICFSILMKIFYDGNVMMKLLKRHRACERMDFFRLHYNDK